MKRAALIESLVNVGFGYLVALALTYTVRPIFGHHPTVGDGIGISLIFTLASIVRTYIVRRFFQKWPPRT